MIAETLAGIALVKSAVDGIKSAIGTANDIGDIAGYIDNLFEGEKQVQQQRAKKSKTGITDQFGIQNVAQEMIDAKIAQEKMQEIAMMVNLRFGPDTWRSIVDERAKRIQEAKEAAAKARREAQRAHDEMMENVKTAAIVSSVIGVALGLVFLAIAILPK
jgi:cell division septum initiation protein DivIVA